MNSSDLMFYWMIFQKRTRKLLSFKLTEMYVLHVHKFLELVQFFHFFDGYYANCLHTGMANLTLQCNATILKRNTKQIIQNMMYDIIHFSKSFNYNLKMIYRFCYIPNVWNDIGRRHSNYISSHIMANFLYISKIWHKKYLHKVLPDIFDLYMYNTIQMAKLNQFKMIHSAYHYLYNVKFKF